MKKILTFIFIPLMVLVYSAASIADHITAKVILVYKSSQKDPFKLYHFGWKSGIKVQNQSNALTPGRYVFYIPVDNYGDYTFKWGDAKDKANRCGLKLSGKKWTNCGAGGCHHYKKVDLKVYQPTIGTLKPQSRSRILKCKATKLDKTTAKFVISN